MLALESCLIVAGALLSVLPYVRLRRSPDRRLPRGLGCNRAPPDEDYLQLAAASPVRSGSFEVRL